jgi:hypothetical protein
MSGRLVERMAERMLKLLPELIVTEEPALGTGLAAKDLL